jgi:phenylpropionate dioxygenase-like ring-hydroxylating dioxygenase large terminal subunit
MSMGCHWLSGVENSLDWCHPAFVHRWTHPQFYAKLLHPTLESTYELRTDDTRCLEVFSPPAESEDDAVPQRTAVRLTFEVPNRVNVKINHGRLTIILQFVPTGAATCRMEWTRASLTGRRLRWSRRDGIVNLQDRRVLESAQRTKGVQQFSVNADASSLAARRIVELAVTSTSNQPNVPARWRVVTVRH